MQLFRTSHLLTAAGVVHGFSVRGGGVSTGAFSSLNLGGSVGDSEEAVRENHRLLREAAGLPGEIATARQVHGDRIVDELGREVLAATGSQDEGADGVLALSGGAVGVRVADCVPVLIYAAEAGGGGGLGWGGGPASLSRR